MIFRQRPPLIWRDSTRLLTPQDVNVERCSPKSNLRPERELLFHAKLFLGT